MGEGSITEGITKAKLDFARGVHEPPTYEYDKEKYHAYEETYKSERQKKG